jgi:hypothetical protein
MRVPPESATLRQEILVLASGNENGDQCLNQVRRVRDSRISAQPVHPVTTAPHSLGEQVEGLRNPLGSVLNQL